MNTCLLITTREVTTSARLNGTIPCLGHIQTLFRTKRPKTIPFHIREYPSFPRILTPVLASFFERNKYQDLLPNSDQYQISPCNINVQSTGEIIRIKDMIIQDEFS